MDRRSCKKSRIREHWCSLIRRKWPAGPPRCSAPLIDPLESVCVNPHKVIGELIVKPGEPAGLEARSTAETRTQWLDPSGPSDPTGPKSPKELAGQELERFREELSKAQELLYASQTHALLVILQALDAAGKDGTIKHVMSGVNPQGCTVTSFKQPSCAS